MQYALCADDNVVWEAFTFSALPHSVLDAKRRNLKCVQCGEFAWFRKESTHGHPPHFCAHHSDECDLRVEYVVVDEHRGDGAIAGGQVESGDAIIVRLDQERGGEVDVSPVKQPPNTGGGDGGRRYILPAAGKESEHQSTLRKILLRLVQSPSFRNSDRLIVFYKNSDEVLIRGLVRDVVAGFADITRERHDGQVMLYWGPIASAGKTPDGKIWLNSSDSNQSVSVVIFPDIVDEFCAQFSISDLDELAGAHVLVGGRCYFAGTGKPIIWCGSPKYIVVRRYRDEKLSGDKVATKNG